MTTIIEQAQNDLAILPTEMQMEALDFILSLKAKLYKKNDFLNEDENRIQEMTKLLDEVSKLNLFSGIEDPVAWQREIRTDTPLFARHETPELAIFRKFRGKYKGGFNRGECYER